MSLFCVHATNGLRVYNDGTAMLCCMSTEQLTDSNGNIASIKDTSIEEIRNGTKAVEIRQALEQGKQHPNCSRCWAEEAGGVVSKRQRDIKHYEDNSLKIVELNLGTTCNLKCRICGPWSSSQWNKEFLKINPSADTEDYKSWLYKLNHSYDDDSLFWEEFKRVIPTLEQIDIYGGEPFMVKKQWELLKYAADNGYTKTQTLHLNTNGTQYDPEKIEIMRSFGRVDVSFSIDGIDKQFEYQRHPAKWQEVLENINKFKKENWNLSVCITVNMYNILYLEEIINFFREMNINYYLNFLHDPSRYNVTNLRSDIKQYITEKYSSNNMWLQKAVEYMNSKETNLLEWHSFIAVTEQLDTIRNENFSQVFPELAKFIKNDL